jgi:autotransporter-associated beta strand protein
MKSLLLCLLLVGTAFGQIPAFPGAQGFGAHATGGRGGDVYYVTNLNASGAGSLRYGIESAPSAGRTIVFAVSGYIPLPGGNLRLVQNKITIAGQTAPGDGIGLRNGTVRISGNNSILRHLRIRHGKNGSGGDCLNVDSSATDTIVDHITMQFSTDENISFFNSSLDRFTMQDSVSAWGLESHNAGGLWDLNRGSCVGSLWAHHHTRNPKARPWGLLEWINNVTFDWGIGFIMGDSQTPASWKANVMGSYFLCPPGRIRSTALEKALIDRNGRPNFSVHVADCLYDSNGDGILNGTDRGYGIVAGAEYNAAENAAPGTSRYVRSNTPFPGATGNIAVRIDDPLTSFKKVVSNTGALRLDANYSGPLRDEVDTLLFTHVVTQKTSRIVRESELPVSNSGFGTLNSGTSPVDTDLDGMPDFWELALGSNPAVQDHNAAFPSSGGLITGPTFFPPGTPAGYTRLEEYLHFKAVPHAVVAKNTSDTPTTFTTDLRKFTSGFSKSPVFTLAGITGGTIQQLAADGVTPAPGGPVVRFTPTLNVHGRAGFEFTVLDADGSRWTRQFAILVSSTGVPRDLLWIGGGNNIWDESTTHWRRTNGAATAFGAGDTALFDDRGSNSPAIALSGSLNPGAVTLTGTRNFSFTGTGSIASTGPLTKAGDTTLTLSRPASFGGGSFLNGGETILNTGATLDGGPIRFTGGSTLRSAYGSADTLTLNPAIVVDEGATGNLVLSQRVNLRGSLSGSGTFNIFSPSNLGAEGRVYLDGASAGCTGIVNLIGGGSGRIAFRAVGGAFNGFNNARLHLDGINVFTGNNSGGNTYAIGALSGNASSAFSGNYNSAGATTLNLGGLGVDTVFDGTIRDGLSQTHLIKSGSGSLTLGGANSYTGGTTVSSGTLRVNGSLGATATQVASGATLAGNFTTAGGLNLATGSIAAPGAAAGVAGTIHVASGGVDVSGATLRFDLSANPTTGNDRITLDGGTMTLRSPAAAFEFNLTDGQLGAGTYLLIDGPSSVTSAPGSPALTHNLPASTRQTFAIQRSGGGATSNAFVRLVVSGTAGNLTWTGSSSTWDLAGSAPWSGGPSGDNRFHNLDQVRFDDSAANRVVTLTGALQPRRVAAAHSTGTYTLGGSGSLTGLATLEKSGGGTLVIANSAANTYAGGTIVSAGTLSLTNTNAPLGTGPVEMRGGTLQLPNSPTFLSNSLVFSGTAAIASAYIGNSTIVNSTAASFSSIGEATVQLNGLAGILSINGRMDGFSGTLAFGNSSGMLRLNSNSIGTNDVNTGSPNAHFDLGTAAGRLNNRNGNITIHLGALSGGPGTFLSGRQSGSGESTTTYLVGAKNLSTTFLGNIAHGGDLAGINLIKTGTGNWTLGGNSDFTGTLAVEGGSLTLTGSKSLSGAATVDPGTTLALAGGTLGAETVNVAGTLQGHGTLDTGLNLSGEYRGRGFITGIPGTLTISGDAFFGDSSQIRLRVGTNSDTLAVAGDLSLTGTLHVQPAPGTHFGRFPLFTHGGTLDLGTITLAGLPPGLGAHLSTRQPGTLALVIDDSDEDGLPDSWEIQHFGNLSASPGDDPDRDGTDNRTEWLLGLDPRSAASAFRARWQAGVLEWPSAPGLSFSVHRSADLAQWQKLATIPASAAGSTTRFTDPAPPPQRTFYRVALENGP